MKDEISNIKIIDDNNFICLLNNKKLCNKNKNK